MNKKLEEYISLATAVAIFSTVPFLAAVSFKKQSHLPPSEKVISLSLENENIDGLSGSAEGLILIDGNTCDVLYRHNSDKRLPMASTTKIMTAIIALENGNLDEPFEIPSSVCGVEGSSIYLSSGEILTLRELLYGLMLESGNDAAEAIAVCVGGTKEKFVDMMNAAAKKMGLCDTHFDNPHGLSSATHYTTAHELALITAYAMKNQTFCNIVSTKRYSIEARENCAARYFSNHNRMLSSFRGCVGVKTGYTLASGRCLVTAAEHDGGRYIAVTLNDRADFADHRVLLEYAESNFKTVCAANVGDLSFEIGKSSPFSKETVVSNTQPIYVSCPKNETSSLELVVEISRDRLNNGIENSAVVTARIGNYARQYALSYN